MSKIDASELIKSLQGSLEEAEDTLKLNQDTIKKCERDILLYRYLLSLVKYEEDSVGVSDIIPPVPYEKPEYIKEDGSVDWSKVPVDTLVEVRDDFQEEWDERYFKSYVQDDAYPYKTFYSGYDSKGAEVGEVGWTQCRLYEGDSK